MFFSRKEATLLEIRELLIHGSPYYDILYAYAEELDPKPQAARIGAEMIYPNAQPGDRVFVERVANVVTRVEKL
jgi:hypothetical protein